jgi:hypothetical protein
MCCGYAMTHASSTQMSWQSDRRNLLIAALFHDFDHLGNRSLDQLNIDRAIAELRVHVSKEDLPHLTTIEALIQATHYPYLIPSESLELSARIIRDADAGQTLTAAWIQQVIFGLAAGGGKSRWNSWKCRVIVLITKSVQTLQCIGHGFRLGRRRYGEGNRQNADDHPKTLSWEHLPLLCRTMPKGTMIAVSTDQSSGRNRLVRRRGRADHPGASRLTDINQWPACPYRPSYLVDRGRDAA